MKPRRLHELLLDMKRDDARASHFAVGAMVLVSVLYASMLTL